MKKFNKGDMVWAISSVPESDRLTWPEEFEFSCYNDHNSNVIVFDGRGKWFSFERREVYGSLAELLIKNPDAVASHAIPFSALVTR